MTDITLKTSENFIKYCDKLLLSKRYSIPIELESNNIKYDSNSDKVPYSKSNRTKSSKLWDTVFHIRTSYRRVGKSSQTASIMWTTSLCVMLLGLASCCVSLPQIQYVNDKPYHLMQSTECRGGKVFEINEVQDIDECKTACLHRNCKAVNLFQVGEFQFKCEILAYVRGYVPAQGAACYVSYY